MRTTTTPLREALGRRIHNARLGAGLSIGEVARRVGVTRSAVHQWESGRTTPSHEHQLKLANALGVGWAPLFRPSTRRTISYAEEGEHNE